MATVNSPTLMTSFYKNRFPQIQNSLTQQNTVNLAAVQLPSYDTFSKTKEISKDSDREKSNTPQIITIAIGLTVVGGAIYKIVKSGKLKSNLSANSQIQPEHSYRQSLANGVSKLIGKKVSDASLSSVLTKEEFLKILPTLKKENFVANKENIRNGIFRADLHSHTTHSDGKISVTEFLDEVSKYSEQVFKKTGNNVIFSITDHDTMEGCREALCIIAQYPEKFKHVRFITGSELSFMHKTTEPNNNPIETSEVLVFGFNPFAEKVSNFFEKIKNKRESMVRDFISDLSALYPDTKFSQEELFKFYQNCNKANFHWKLNHYGQTKRTLSLTAKSKNLNPEKYYAEEMTKAGTQTSLGQMKELGFIENWINEDPAITNIRQKYTPTEKNNMLFAHGENNYNEIITAFNDQDSVLGFAHPYYISERVNIHKIPEMVDNMISQSNGLLKLTESHHQAYKNDKKKILTKDITQINKLMESYGLIPLGGLDNHCKTWLR